MVIGAYSINQILPRGPHIAMAFFFYIRVAGLRFHDSGKRSEKHHA